VLATTVGNASARTTPITAPWRKILFALAPACTSRKIRGHGPTHYIGEGPSNDGVIVVEGNVRNVPERCVISKALHSAPWPFGHRVFFVPGTKMRSHCFLRLHALYDAEGASHDFVEQGFHDQDAGADHSCTGRRSHSEGGKSALRL
jgi:hypothetical protein